jgi:hypothetical protein
MRHAHVWFVLFITVGFFSFNPQSQAALSDPLTTIELDTPVHFLASDGSDLVVEAGTYTIEPAEEWIRLMSGERHDAVLIEAKPGSHELEIEDTLSLSIPGTAGGQADNHYVMLLLPGGQSLEATGTYSGLRPRGLFDQAVKAVNKAKRDTNRAYRQARSTVRKTQKSVQKGMSRAQKEAQKIQKDAQRAQRQAAAKARKGIRTAKNAALQAKREVEKTARQVAGKVKGSVQAGVSQLKDNPFLAKLESERKTLEAVRKLRLDPLFQCLKGARSTRVNLPRDIQEFLTDPGNFANARMNEIWNVVEANFDQVMGEDLQALQGTKRPLSIQQILDRSARTMQRLADRHAGVKCLHQFLQPHMSKIKKAAVASHRTLESKTKKLVNTKIAPIVYRTVASNLQSVFAEAIKTGGNQPPRSARIRSRGIPGEEAVHDSEAIETEEFLAEETGGVVSRGISKDKIKGLFPGAKEIHTIAKGVATEYLLSPAKIRDLTAKVQRLADVVGNQNAAGPALAELQQALNANTVLPELVLFDIGSEILRFIGHKYLDSDLPGNGRFWVNMAMATMNFTEDTVGNVVVSACGLIPEVGAAGCSSVKEIIEAGYHYATAPPIEAAMAKGLDVAFDRAMNKAKEEIKNGHDPKRFRDKAGPLGILLDRFPTKKAVIALAEADPAVKELQATLFAYHTSVGQLAQAAAK